MKKYNRVMLGPQSKYAEKCYNEGFIGADFGITENLEGKLPDNWREFNSNFRPIWLKAHPNKSKVSAGLACGMLWTIARGLHIGDIVISPNGHGSYYIGEISSDYKYVGGQILQHRRLVKWYPTTIERSSMSQDLKNSTGSVGTTCNISDYAEEIEKLIGGNKPPTIVSTDSTVEDPSVFALEKHLEDFLVHNWASTELGKDYEIFSEDGEVVGQQYPSDTGPIDILAVSKDQNTILVVELKKGRVSDNVVGQIQRYMGYVKDELAEPHQDVKGIIIGLEDDMRIQRALSVTQNIEFYRYKVNFSLFRS